jgi:hypothetical protein
MDNAVALVRAYLQLNGYFTITEYPIVRKLDSGGFRTLTEIDVAAFRLPWNEPDYEPDPALKVPHGKADMIIGEVKESRAVITRPRPTLKSLRRSCGASGIAPRPMRALLRARSWQTARSTRGPAIVRGWWHSGAHPARFRERTSRC